jgi:hypothetical protein
MKQIITTVLWLFSLSCFSQYSEFTVHDNGLIYNPETMNKLGRIVDSLNLKFKTCDLAHDFYSVPQGYATYISMKGKRTEARQAIEANLPLHEFLKLYPKAAVKDSIYILRRSYSNYKNQKIIEYAALPNGYRNDGEIELKDKKSNRKMEGWILGESKDFEAMYLHGLQSTALPLPYARLVQYVDCMVDTTTQIFFPNAKGKTYPRVDEYSEANKFISWAENFPGKPSYPDYEDDLSQDEWESQYIIFDNAYRKWDSLRLANLDKVMKTASNWYAILESAADEALATGDSDQRLEFYVARYIDKGMALQLKRSHRVIGGCSQDQSPRYHAQAICQLAAETTQWDIFLRSHLDIMNDRFDRLSDGSYAYAGRKTYLKELEELGIDVHDLLIGTSFRVSNASDNHYYGYINRVGRALADTEQKALLDDKLYGIIMDKNLDVYNRLLMAYVFNNYIYNLEDKDQQKIKEVLLDNAVKSLPKYAQDVYNNK